MLVVLLLKFLKNRSCFTFVSSFSFFFLLKQVLVLVYVIQCDRLCWRLRYNRWFPIFNYLVWVIELNLWSNLDIVRGFLHGFVGNRFLDMKRSFVFFAGKFCAWNWRVLVLKLSRQTILGIAINQTNTDAAINLDSLILQRVKQDDIVPPQVHIHLFGLKIKFIFTHNPDVNITGCHHLNTKNPL